MMCYLGTGRRKTAIAQVRLMDGKGLIQVNGKTFEEFFPGERLTKAVTAPLVATNTRNEYDILIKVKGGGPCGQASAAALGIARALAKIDRKHHAELRKRGLLTRDPRMVERKHHGFRKARRDKQFSKR
ncbi:MAG: 30S ribosomal protein S9 [Planctomycetota bacterium]